MFKKTLGLGEDSVPLYSAPSIPMLPSMTSPYIPGYVPGSAPTFIPGSSYATYGPLAPSTYGDITKENKAKETYVSNDDENMEGMSMFAGNVGAEEFGPPVPTTTQEIVQTGRDVLTSKVTLNQTNLMYIVGGALAIYLLYHYIYDVKEVMGGA